MGLHTNPPKVLNPSFPANKSLPCVYNLPMNCPICNHGTLAPGVTTVTLEREQLTLVFKSVPARVCDNCGEQFLDETVSAELLEQANAAAKAGVQIEVRQFAAA